MDWYFRDISWMSWRGSVVPSGSPQSSWDRDLEPTNMSKAVFKDHLPEQLWQMVHIEKSSTTFCFARYLDNMTAFFYLKNHLYQHFHNKKKHEKNGFQKVGPETFPTIQNVATFQPSINKGDPWDPWLGGGPLVGSTSGPAMAVTDGSKAHSLQPNSGMEQVANLLLQQREVSRRPWFHGMVKGGKSMLKIYVLVMYKNKLKGKERYIYIYQVYFDILQYTICFEYIDYKQFILKYVGPWFLFFVRRHDIQISGPQFSKRFHCVCAASFISTNSHCWTNTCFWSYMGPKEWV